MIKKILPVIFFGFSISIAHADLRWTSPFVILYTSNNWTGWQIFGGSMTYSSPTFTIGGNAYVWQATAPASGDTTLHHRSGFLFWGGDGGEAGSGNGVAGVSLRLEPDEVSVSTLILPRSNFNVDFDGASGASITWRGSTGTVTGATLFRGSVTISGIGIVVRSSIPVFSIMGDTLAVTSDGRVVIGTRSASSLLDILGGSLTVRGAGAGLIVGGVSFLGFTSTSDAQQTKFVNFRSTTDTNIDTINTHMSTTNIHAAGWAASSNTIRGLAGGIVEIENGVITSSMVRRAVTTGLVETGIGVISVPTMTNISVATTTIQNATFNSSTTFSSSTLNIGGVVNFMQSTVPASGDQVLHRTAGSSITYWGGDLDTTASSVDTGDSFGSHIATQPFGGNQPLSASSATISSIGFGEYTGTVAANILTINTYMSTTNIHAAGWLASSNTIIMAASNTFTAPQTFGSSTTFSSSTLNIGGVVNFFQSTVPASGDQVLHRTAGSSITYWGGDLDTTASSVDTGDSFGSHIATQPFGGSQPLTASSATISSIGFGEYTGTVAANILTINTHMSTTNIHAAGWVASSNAITAVAGGLVETGNNVISIATMTNIWNSTISVRNETVLGSMTVIGNLAFISTEVAYGGIWPEVVMQSTNTAEVNFSSHALVGKGLLDHQSSTAGANAVIFKLYFDNYFQVGSTPILRSLRADVTGQVTLAESYVLTFATASSLGLSISTGLGSSIQNFSNLNFSSPTVAIIQTTTTALGGTREVKFNPGDKPLNGVTNMIGAGDVYLFARCVRDGTSANDPSNMRSAPWGLVVEYRKQR